ncbi:MAG: type I-F CRISPR-associated endoribonuclease Cas6/Csy4 [bacterium]
MKYYQDVTLMPGPEIPLYFIWEKVYQQLHLALVEIQDENGKVPVGAGFPGYEQEPPSLGNKLRLFAPSRSDLEALDAKKWLSRLADYVHLTGMRPVPENVSRIVSFKRVQPKSNNARLARRKAKREGISMEEALEKLKSHQVAFSSAPFIRIKSHSSGRQYRLFIERVEQKEPLPHEKFSTYGLSGKSAVPFF